MTKVVVSIKACLRENHANMKKKTVVATLKNEQGPVSQRFPKMFPKTELKIYLNHNLRSF